VEGNDDHDLVLALLQQMRVVAQHPTKPSTRGGGTVTTYLQMQPTGDTLLISSTGGWSKLGKKQAFFLQDAHDSGGKNLVIFDADYDTPEHESGGHVKRLVSLLDKVLPYDPAPAVFLFPAPAQDGDLELLLLQLTQPQHQRVMACYDGYEQCLKQYLDRAGQPYYNAPSNKRRLYDYVNVMPLMGNDYERHHKNGGQKLFDNADLWDLTASAIQPLRAFLDQYIR
jgi:hypothetical protein